MIIKTKTEIGFISFILNINLLKLKRTCSVKDCNCNAEAIIVFANNTPAFTLCKAHYEHGLINNNGWDYELDLSNNTNTKKEG